MIIQALESLATGLDRRGTTAPSAGKAEKAHRLARHIRDFLLPRATDLTTPLVVVLLGSTGAGKSSLFNALAGRKVSESGLLRPTTRRAVALVNPADAGSLRLSEVSVVNDPSSPPGLVLVDSPDFDSVELANRKLALDLLEAADLVIFVTTVTRYADFVPWTVLTRASERGVPMLAVINRMPADEGEAQAVMDDYRRLLTGGDIEKLGAFGKLEVVSVPEGALDRSFDGLARDAIAPILGAIERLRQDTDSRKEIAHRALRAAVDGLPDSVEQIAREVAAEEEALAGLVKLADEDNRRGLALLEDEISGGTLLRGEVLRQWLDFVRAGPTARFLSEGIGKLVASVRSLFRPQAPALAPDVREAAFSDLIASAVRRADDAAQKTANAWTEDDLGAVALASHPELWGSDPKLRSDLQAGLEKWVDEIANEIAAVGQQRKGWAQAATIGLNVLGSSVMLAVFLHTGGLTGAEIGIGAATAIVNQKLLEAIFGEANVAAFVKQARDRLHEVLQRAFTAERDRFLTALGPVSSGLATSLRADATAAKAALS
ncbi:MAG: GTPase [Acidimicrobiia bacterium]